VRWESIAKARSILEQERGTLIKDWGGLAPVALIYPNTYYVGMSSLGFQTLYRLLNEAPGLVCERAFQAVRDSRNRPSEPVLSIESQRRMQDFAALAFSLSFETDYLNMIDLLRRAGIPPLAQERDDSYPLVLAGGPAVSANPAPLAPILDVIAIGEVEEIFPRLAEVLAQGIRTEKAELLAELARIPGIYVPQLHRDEAFSVRRQWVKDVDASPTHSAVLTPNTEFGNMYLIEIARGCRQGCRFCLAGFAYRPTRERSVDVLLDQAKEGLALTKRVGLVASSVSDHTGIDDLATRLREMGAHLSVSSLRADSLSAPLLEALSESGARTLTIAPEAGSERLRRVINKGLSRDDLISATEAAREFGFAHLKLYFMLGLPTESEDDVVSIANLVKELARRFRRRVSVKLTPFVPKAQTPFERRAMCDGGTLNARLRAVTKELRAAGVSVNRESVEWAQVQGMLARGDEGLGHALARLEGLNLGSWRRALKLAGLDTQTYLRARDVAETLPWHVVDAGTKRSYLQRENERANSAEPTPPCPPDYASCQRCGVCNPA